MSRSIVILLLVLLALPGCRQTAPTGSGAERPNVILIVTDDQGYGDVGAHGNRHIETPNLDRLHDESIRLTNFHVNPTCSPTRAALMTGRYASRAGVWHTIMGRSLLPADETTMAEVFAASGYATGIFGKWHLGDNYPFRPQDQGFQEVVVHGGGGIGQTPDFWGNDYYDDRYWHNGESEEFEGYSTDVFFDQALEFIRAHRDEPFFTYLPLNIAHRPWNPPRGYAASYREQGLTGDLAAFYGMITQFDERLGQLRDRLEEWGLAQNTILIFMTDNGTSARGYNAGLRGRKGSVYEGGHRVPFYLHYPAGNLTGGRDVDQLAAHIDVLPTLTELCNLTPPQQLPLDGRSLVPLLGADAERLPRTLFVQSQRIDHPRKGRTYAVMTDRWRLVRGDELYDLSADPDQSKNVAEEYPQVVDSLRRAYEAWWSHLSADFDEYARIVLGAEEANPALLTAHDWHAPQDEVPWNQAHIRSTDFCGNGFWAVDVARSGTYVFVLRRRPAAASRPLQANRARISIGGRQKSKAIPPDAEKVSFTLDLHAGPTLLQTWLTGGPCSGGAYYVNVLRLRQRQ